MSSCLTISRGRRCLEAAQGQGSSRCRTLHGFAALCSRNTRDCDRCSASPPELVCQALVALEHARVREGHLADTVRRRGAALERARACWQGHHQGVAHARGAPRRCSLRCSLCATTGARALRCAARRLLSGTAAACCQAAVCQRSLLLPGGTDEPSGAAAAPKGPPWPRGGWGSGDRVLLGAQVIID